MKTNKQNWFQLVLQLKGSVILAIYKRVIGFAIFGFVVSVLYYFKIPISQPVLGSVIPSIVLGLLLVFRTNTAYDRFWEGRRLWGNLANDARNMTWQIGVIINEIEPKDRADKIAVMHLVAAFMVACKLHLRSEPINSELEELMSQSQCLQLQTISNKPIQIVSWIGNYIQQQYKRGNEVLFAGHVLYFQGSMRSMIESLGHCERILTTPLPLAYFIHLKQLLLIYCLLLPFQLVKDLGWATGLVVGLISFTLLGIEEIGIEIENPFGYDTNDLPLDAICDLTKYEIEEFIKSNPSFQSNSDQMY
ncbi:bestrophin family protein [Anabaena sp. UHCC 0451]|uniref:bestrophin family protein n=1 Tax=Anabaena sp. UHCC 0451 TaxID=2055235 RepID=UPI002B2047A0|nr:bestrophin family ion channel [Anabaena sp. UHCC 0451]MEA5576850.1 bestrophin family ion channel [Anabaena sp. UHCC 0451]